MGSGVTHATTSRPCTTRHTWHWAARTLAALSSAGGRRYQLLTCFNSHLWPVVCIVMGSRLFSSAQSI